MVQRTQSERQALMITVHTVSEPSRVAQECVARAYAVVVPVVRRPLPVPGAARQPGDTPAAAGSRREGVA